MILDQNLDHNLDHNCVTNARLQTLLEPLTHVNTRVTHLHLSIVVAYKPSQSEIINKYRPLGPSYITSKSLRF